MVGRIPLSGICLSLALSPLLTFAADATDTEQLQNIIRKQHRHLLHQQQQIKVLQNQMSVVEKKQASKKKSTNARVNLKQGMKVKSADGQNTFRVGGRLHVDSAVYNEDKRAFGNGIEIRRARINVAGKFKKNWKYRAEYDFAHNRASVKDAYITYSYSRQNAIKAGQFQVPFSLEELGSSNNIMFMERALPNIFVPGYKTGISISNGGDNSSASAAVYGEAVNSQNNSNIDNGWGVAGRLTYAPLLTNSLLLHLGAAVEYQEPDGDNSMRLRTTPETHVSRTRLLNTDTISDVDHFENYGLEIATRVGSFSMQGEYIASVIERNVGNTLEFDGWYASTGWFITGERRIYRARKGAFRGVTPKHGYGALELAIRYSSLNLNDDNVYGGRENNWTLGMNWYPTSSIRFMLNYTQANAEPSTAEVNPDEFRGIKDSPDFFQMRMQIKF